MKKKDKKPLSQSEIIDTYLARLEKKDKKNKHKNKRPSFTRRLRIVLSIFMALLIAVLSFVVIYLDVFDLNLLEKLESAFTKEETTLTQFTSSTLSEPTLEDIELMGDDSTTENNEPVTKAERPSKLFAVTLIPGVDFSLPLTDEAASLLIDEISGSGFTSLFVNLNSKGALLIDRADGKAALEALGNAARGKSIAVFGVLDITNLSLKEFGFDGYSNEISQSLENMILNDALDGIMLKGIEYSGGVNDFKNYVATGNLSSFKNYKQNLVTSVAHNLSIRARAVAPSKLFGLITDSVYATKEVLETGIDATAETQLLRDKNADVLLWMEKGYFDIVFVEANTTTTSKKLPFEELADWWNQNTPPSCDIGFILASDSALKGEGDWKNPDQLGRQLQILNEINRYVFCFNSYSALKENQTGSSQLVYKYITGEVEEDYVLRELSITSPQKTDFTTYEKSMAFIGASDPNFPLLVNGKEAERTKDGYFSLQLDLKVGDNKISFEHKGVTKTFNVTYRYVVIKSFTPASTLKQDGNSAILVTVLARNGSKITATLNGSVFNLELAEEEAHSDFATYQGIVTLPEGKSSSYSLGKIKFSGSHNGVNESFYGGEIIINKKVEEVSSEYVSSEEEIISSQDNISGETSDAASNENSNNQSGDTSKPSSSTQTETGSTSSKPSGYSPVGNKLVAEVVKYQIETFDGDKINDLSQPYNSYLPKGTLDYCDESTIYDPSSGNTYRKLRYGKRVYTTSKGVANIRTMRGSLPSKNKLSVLSLTTDGSHTVLKLDTDWKAPFKLELCPQKYQSSTGSARGTITSATFNYIDITFCYASAFGGAFNNLANSPIFSRAQIIKNTSDYTLRLYLKKTGAFYGWTADYDNAGNLVFKFLNPKTATKANNKYGGRLDGITIVVDPGHGGSDPGAVGAVSNKNLTEANRSLLLSKLLREKLESIGARVIMTRTTDVSLTTDERILKVRNNNPNLVVSVHRNAATTTSANGFSAHYFNPYTKAAADKIKNATAAAGTYKNSKTAWHVFYMSRISNCPVVLTENGYMSNSTDFSNMKSDSWNSKCADAITKGIVDYFLSI